MTGSSDPRVDPPTALGDRDVMRTKSIGKLFAAILFSGTVLACYAHVETGGQEECRTVLRNRGEVENCMTRCHDGECKTHCQEQERVARERHCWVD
jgi:hypothetical protein